MKLLLSIIPIFLLSSCATFTKDQCMNFNWEGKGHESAMKGERTHEGLAFYETKCQQDHGVVPNQEAFKKGYKEGNKVFCRASNGRSFGMSGGEYKGTCSEKLELKFLKNYQIGRNSFLNTQVETLKQKIKELESENEELEDKLETCLDSKES